MAHAVCAVLLISEKAPSPVSNGVDIPCFVGFSPGTQHTYVHCTLTKMYVVLLKYIKYDFLFTEVCMS